MAISRWRTVARTSSRLATFAQAISRTKLTAPSSIHSDDAHVAHDHLLQRLHAEAGLRRHRVRKGLAELGGGRRELRGGAVERDTRLQAAGASVKKCPCMVLFGSI